MTDLSKIYCELCGEVLHQNTPTRNYVPLGDNRLYHQRCLLDALEKAKKYDAVDRIVIPRPPNFVSIVDVWECKHCGGNTYGYCAEKCRHCGAAENWKGRSLPSNKVERKQQS